MPITQLHVVCFGSGKWSRMYLKTRKLRMYGFTLESRDTEFRDEFEVPPLPYFQITEITTSVIATSSWSL